MSRLFTIRERHQSQLLADRRNIATSTTNSVNTAEPSIPIKPIYPIVNRSRASVDAKTESPQNTDMNINKVQSREHSPNMPTKNKTKMLQLSANHQNLAILHYISSIKETPIISINNIFLDTDGVKNGSTVIKDNSIIVSTILVGKNNYKIFPFGKTNIINLKQLHISNFVMISNISKTKLNFDTWNRFVSLSNNYIDINLNDIDEKSYFVDIIISI